MKIITTAAAIAAVAALSACSFNPIGESTFDCNRKENPSEYCRSFKALERSTNGVLPESRFDKEFRMSDYDRANGLAPDGPQEKSVSRVEQSPSIAALPHNRGAAQQAELIAGAPVRRAPVIQRTWIKQFVDENDMVQGEQKVYKEVAASRWTGFSASRGPVAAGGAGALPYPHKVQDSPVAAAADAGAAVSQANGFNQPEASAEGSVGSATPPAASGGK